MEKKKRKIVISKETAKKIVANPKTPAGLKAYWKKKYNLK